MAFSSGSSSITLEEILSKVSEGTIINHYLGIDTIPCVISSPLRQDNKPSFGIYSNNNRIHFIDYSTGDRGGLYDLLSAMWRVPYDKVLERIEKDIINYKGNCSIYNREFKGMGIHNKVHTKLKIKIREWKDYDLEYWNSYGISKHWLDFAEVYPISHKFIIRDGKTYTFRADKFAYAYIERKEGHISTKIYQPFNKSGYKWSNDNDGSVIGLWTKVPKTADKICICSSLKDALCLWENTGIPSLSLQGEGYLISETAMTELKRRFNHIYILLDNDAPGKLMASKLSNYSGFTNIELPLIEGAKDISDLYKQLNNKQKFKEILLSLFNN